MACRLANPSVCGFLQWLHGLAVTFPWSLFAASSPLVSKRLSLICSTSRGRRPGHVGRVGFIVWTFLVLFGSLSCCQLHSVDDLSFLDLRCHFVNSLRRLSIGFCFVASMDFLSPSPWTSVGFCSPHFLEVHLGFQCQYFVPLPVVDRLPRRRFHVYRFFHSVVCPWMIGRLAPLHVYRYVSVVPYAYGCLAALTATSLVSVLGFRGN